MSFFNIRSIVTHPLGSQNLSSAKKKTEEFEKRRDVEEEEKSQVRRNLMSSSETNERDPPCSNYDDLIANDPKLSQTARVSVKRFPTPPSIVLRRQGGSQSKKNLLQRCIYFMFFLDISVHSRSVVETLRNPDVFYGTFYNIPPVLKLCRLISRLKILRKFYLF